MRTWQLHRENYCTWSPMHLVLSIRAICSVDSWKGVVFTGVQGNYVKQFELAWGKHYSVYKNCFGSECFSILLTLCVECFVRKNCFILKYRYSRKHNHQSTCFNSRHHCNYLAMWVSLLTASYHLQLIRLLWFQGQGRRPSDRKILRTIPSASWKVTKMRHRLYSRINIVKPIPRKPHACFERWLDLNDHIFLAWADTY